MTSRSRCARLWIVLVLIVCAHSSVQAQQLPEVPADNVRQTPMSQKSPTTAALLSLAGTAMPAIAFVTLAHTGSWESVGFGEMVVLFSVGFTVGPSLGHFYSGGVGLLPYRAAVVGAIDVVILAAVAAQSIEMFYGAFVLAEFIGIPALAAFSLLDIANAPKAARRYNERRGLGAVRIQPFYSAAHKAPGLAVSISF